MAFDQTIHDALQRLTASLQQEFDARLKTTAAELSQTVEQERQAAEAHSRATFAAELAAAQEEATRRLAEETGRARAEAEQQFLEVASRVRGEVDSLRRERDDLQQALTSARETSEHTAIAARQQAEEAIAAARAQAERATVDLDEVRGQLAAAEQALEGLRESAAAASADTDRTLAELNDLRTRAENDRQALEELRRFRVEDRVEERQDKLATLDRIVASLRRIDGAASLSDVLNALAESIAAEAPRSAVLVTAPDGFRPFRMSGFAATPRTLTREEASTLTRGLSFDPLPPDHVGFAVPIEVGSQTVAIVYADDCTGHEEQVPASWPEAVEVLGRHAGLKLAMLTALRTVQAARFAQPVSAAPVSTVGHAATASSPSTTGDDQSARRYARLLVSEIKLYNEATVRLGRMNRDLFERLRPEIERARQLYEQRVPAHVPARANYFDDELVQTLADGDPTLLGGRR